MAKKKASTASPAPTAPTTPRKTKRSNSLKRPGGNAGRADALDDDVPVVKRKKLVKQTRSPAEIEELRNSLSDVAAKVRGKKLTQKQIRGIKDTTAYAHAMQLNVRGTGQFNELPGVDKAKSNYLVMPMPFIIQCATQTSGIPFSCMVELTGDKGSNKSSFILGMAQIINGQTYVAPDYSGWCEYLSSESKPPEQLIWSICGYPDYLEMERPELLRPVIPTVCDSMDEWQAIWQNRLESYRKLIPRNRQIPLLGAVDSLTAKMLEETYKKIETVGSAQRTFSIEAFSIKQWLSKVLSDMEHLPVILFLVNHVRRIKETEYVERREKPGGKYVGYAETLDFDLKPMGKPQREKLPATAEYPFETYNRVKLKVEKSSLGETHRSVPLIFRYTMVNPPKYAMDQDSLRQESQWMWGESLSWFLSDKYEGNELLRDRLNDIVDVKAVGGKGGHFYTCKRLFGKEVVHGEELGQAIEADEKIMYELRRVFGVVKYPRFEPFTDYNGIRGRRHIDKGKSVKTRLKATGGAAADADE